MSKIQKNSLNIQIWKYFLLFSVFILFFLWLFQVLFLNAYYRSQKKKDVYNVADAIKNLQEDNNFENTLNALALDKEVCVEINDKNFYAIYSSAFFGKGCYSNKNITLNYKADFVTSSEKEKVYNYINPKYNNKTIIYAIKLNNDKYAFIKSTLDPIDTTTRIIRKQLIIITIVVLALSFILSYVFSKYISKPIIKINEVANKLARKEFNVNFDNESNILELEELVNTLNYAKEELSKTEELRRDLMANVSHDLKTPLTMIKAYAEMTKDLHKNNPSKRDNDMNIIIAEVDRLTLLVNDILALSSMQTKINNLEREEFDLIALIKNILKRYSVFQETENYKFIFNHKENKIIINADKKKLEQVIYNLVNNAINYTGDDLCVEVNVVNNEKNILVEIKDSGKGINKEDLPYIWDKYYKSEKKHKRNVVGTGLGLAIVRNILELHSYKYGVKSEKNKGTIFYFYISKEKNEVTK